MQSDAPEGVPPRTTTLEAFADTIVPGEKRSPSDTAIAGASDGGGAVAAGAIELLEDPATGLASALDDFADALNRHAAEYARQHGIEREEALPPFVSLPFEHRTELVRALTGPDHPEQEMWVSLALFSNMAFDTAAHLHTTDALAAGHPGLLAIGYSNPDPDGLWRFPAYSYGRQLADLHPDTTRSGSPA